MIEYGFFDSINGDRRYNSKNFSEHFEGLISDGVYSYVGDKLKVSPGEGMSVIVGTGRAMILNRYVKNTSLMPIDISSADSQCPRSDAIVVGIDLNERIGEIKVIQGIPGEAAERPEIPSDTNIRYYVLAYIRIDANATSIPPENIYDMRGTSECPWVACIIDQIDTSGIIDQYKAMMNNFEAEAKVCIDKLQADVEEIQKLRHDVDIISSQLKIISGYIVVELENGGEGPDSELYADRTIRITGVGSINEREFEKREDFGAAEINIGGSVGMGAFGGCSELNSVNVDCAKICDNAFLACYKLTSLTIGKSVSEIGSNIIASCGVLMERGVRVMYAGTISEWNAITKADDWVGFSTVVENGVVICTDGTVEV